MREYSFVSYETNEAESVLGQGTTVHMKKKLGTTSWIEQEE